MDCVPPQALKPVATYGAPPPRLVFLSQKTGTCWQGREMGIERPWGEGELLNLKWGYLRTRRMGAGRPGYQVSDSAHQGQTRCSYGPSVKEEGRREKAERGIWLLGEEGGGIEQFGVGG